MKTLADLAVGESAVTSRVDGTDDLAMRLMEMGLTPQVEVSVIGCAPLGDPIEIELRGYRLSLRRTEAARVHLQ